MTNTRPRISLAAYENSNFSRGRSKLVELAWLLIQSLLVSSALPGSPHRIFLLRIFGARIGRDVVLKPGVKVKFPWRLWIGSNSWIGESVWIDNLADVKIGTNVCVSQGAYLCTGSHNWTSPTFDLITKPIVLKEGAWVAANCTVGPGVTVGEGAVLGLGSTTSKNLEPWSIYSGSPAVFIKRRILNFPESI